MTHYTIPTSPSQIGVYQGDEMKEGNSEYLSLHDREIWKKACKWQKEQDAKICFDLMEETKMDHAEGCRACGNAIEDQE